MHGVYLFKAGCCCLPVLIGCARAFLFVRAFAVQGCPVCKCDSKQKAAKGLAFFFLRLASCDHGWRHGSHRHELRRGALRLRCRAKQTGFVRCGSGICPPDGNWWRGGGKWQRTGVCRPASAPRWLGALGNTHAREIEATCGAEDAGATDPTPSPPPHLRAACCPAPSPITAG